MIATKHNLKKWKISDNDICSVCGDTETIEHFLLQCNSIVHFWQQIIFFFSSIGYDNVVCLKSLVTCYTPGAREYDDINCILNIISFTVYKSYFMSYMRTKPINVLITQKSECRIALYHNLKIHLKTLIDRLMSFL